MRRLDHRITQDEYYRGVRMVPYDLVKELALALAGLGILVLVLAAVLSSPDVPSVTIQQWAQNAPVDFETTATAELAGTTISTGYGNPYNTNGAGQSWGFVDPNRWFGTRIPVDSANEFVIQPLTLASAGNTDLATALDTWNKASSDQQTKWTAAYTDALGKATVSNGTLTLPQGDYGPLTVMMGRLLGIGQSGGLDGLLLVSGRFYQVDYTRALLFMGDGTYLSGLAANANLTGSQWGMMNETGSYPGQTWLWLYTMWYQVWPFNSSTGVAGLNSGNADLGIVLLMGVLTFALAIVPFIPVLRDIPRWIPIHRVIWREYYAPRRRSA